MSLFDKIILGIDPGSRVAGYGVLRIKSTVVRSSADVELLDVGILKASDKLPYLERIGKLHTAVFELAKSIKPDIWVLEKAFANKNISSAIKLGEVRGIFIGAAARFGHPVREITPAQVKKTVAGNGRADKQQVALAVGGILGLGTVSLPADATDALAIGLAYAMTYSPTTEKPANSERSL